MATKHTSIELLNKHIKWKHRKLDAFLNKSNFVLITCCKSNKKVSKLSKENEECVCVYILLIFMYIQHTINGKSKSIPFSP